MENARALGVLRRRRTPTKRYGGPVSLNSWMRNCITSLQPRAS